MSNRTKQALAVSLKKLLQEKQLDKITIGELAADCGISRMTFYYHFRDIYDLVEWMCVEDLRAALQEKKTYVSWQEGLFRIFEASYENRTYISNLNRSMRREQIEGFWTEQSYELIMNVVREQAAGMDVAAEKLEFIANFYKHAFVGALLDWFDQGMKADYPQIVEDISVVMQGNIANALQNFIKRSDL